jgi:hypothetical protein
MDYMYSHTYIGKDIYNVFGESLNLTDFLDPKPMFIILEAV